ncbi:MAG: TonB family protein [Acidobacteria bacterium]|nr:TonB family protein [Acidobacteriota bacterium]
MPREIFGEVAHPSPRLGSRSRYTLPVSIVAHAAAAVAVVIVPLFATDAIPVAHEMVGAFIAQPTAPLPPPVAPSTSRASTPVRDGSSAAPKEAPAQIEPETDTTSTFIPGALPTSEGLADGTLGGLNIVVAPPPVPAPAPVTKPVPVGGVIKETAKIRHVAPIYPVIAQQVRVDGIVIVEAIIGADGRVQEARVLRSKPLLDEAALTAVREWIFTPTTLNGVAVPVIMTVTVNFRLH